MSGWLLSLGFSYLPGAGAFVHDQNPSSFMAQTIAVINEDADMENGDRHVLLIGRPGQLKMLVTALYNVIPEDMVVVEGKAVMREKNRQKFNYNSAR